MKTTILSAGLLAAALITPSVSADTAAVGQPAPNFTLTDSQGAKHDLSSLKGKFVVLEWVNHECPFVGKHYGSGNMQKLQKAYTGKGVVWLSVNSSAAGKQGHVTPEQANALTREKGASASAVLLDPEGTMGRAYAAKTTPHMFVIDAAGHVAYQGG